MLYGFQLESIKSIKSIKRTFEILAGKQISNQFIKINDFWSKTFGQQTFDQLNVTQIVGKETKVFIILCPSTKCLAAKWFLIKNHKTHCLIKNLLANRHLDDRHFAYSVSGQKMCRLVIWPRVE